MAKQTIDKIDVAGKRVLMRVDFNVPMDEGEIADDRRIRMALPTIRSVIDRGGRLVLMSHLGRPAGTGYEKGTSLKACAARLSEALGKPVAFPSTDCVDAASKAAAGGLKNGEVMLLENLRHHKAEQKGDPAFAAHLAEMGDVYCNDAFGTCHRPDASMVSVPKTMKSQGKPAVCGLLVQKEIRYLHAALENPKRPFVAVLGGAKVSDKILTIERLLGMCDHILIGGAMAYTLMKALGKKVGSSRVEEDRISDAKRILDKAAIAKCELHLPSDHTCGTVFAEQAGDVQVFQDSIKDGYLGLDIGPATAARFGDIIRAAGTVVWNGPMGVFEWRQFSIGTRVICEALAEATGRGATTIVGGGDSAAAAEQFGVADRVSHVSTGGGASLEMLEGKRFEAVDVLDEA